MGNGSTVRGHRYSGDGAYLLPVYRSCQVPFSGGLVTLAERIRKAREDAGLTQDGLADEVGVYQGTVSDWETGATQRISLSHLKAVARVTGFALDWLRTEAGPERAPEASPREIEAPGGAGGFAEGYRRALTDVIRWAADQMPATPSVEALKRVTDETEDVLPQPPPPTPGRGPTRKGSGPHRRAG